MGNNNNINMKYIVYITTNTVNKKIYIGVHKTENPAVFDGYLGCGVKVQDRYTYTYLTSPFPMAVRKYGPDKFIRKTLKEFDILEEALALEAVLVNEEFINRKDTYNVTLGGGMPPVISKTIYQYDMSGEFLREWPSISEASRSLRKSGSSIGKAIDNKTPSSGYLWTDVKLDKLDLSEFNIGKNKRQCHLYDIEGNYLQSFQSHGDCAEYLKMPINKISKSVRGEYALDDAYIVSYRKVDKLEKHKPNFQPKPVYQYDLDGNYIREFSGPKEAMELLGCRLNIAAACRSFGSSGGYQWSYVKVDKMAKHKSVTRTRRVGMYDETGELIKEFRSVRLAKEFCCGAPGALSGNRKKAGGYYWRYIDD